MKKMFLRLKDIAVKLTITIKYNKRVKPKEFRPNDLVLKKVNNDGKLLGKKSWKKIRQSHKGFKPSHTWENTQ